jgi:hypothetical protein
MEDVVKVALTKIDNKEDVSIDEQLITLWNASVRWS